MFPLFQKKIWESPIIKRNYNRFQIIFNGNFSYFV